MNNTFDNDHLNLFYSYGPHGCENNLTRALLIVLRNLSPVHQRIFIDSFFTMPSDPLSGADFYSAIQVYTSSEEEERLTCENGRLIGITYSGDQAINRSQEESTSDTIPDALFADNNTGHSLLFEAKLKNTLYWRQLHGHFNKKRRRPHTEAVPAERCPR